MSQRTLRVVRDVADDQAGDLACDTAGVVSSGLPTVPAAQVVRAQGTGAFVLDVRDHRQFAVGHLAGSVNVGLDDPAFVDVCAGLLAPGVEIVVVGPVGPAERAAELLRAEGLGPIVGRLADPGAASVSRRTCVAGTGTSTEPGTVVESGTVSRPGADGGCGQVVDVRECGGPSPRGALRIPLDELLGRLVELRPDATVTVLDDDGRRSSTAASLLRACGFADVVEMLAGAPAVRPRLRLLASA
ncbi:hypothetical protein Psed_0338 [Pseudonocardia dioxanivorans CB1190]|uniref:Rhodanese domain-containing protein n=1 Tax=Pseudonocardia dioxanivorans (strain ATCC 55486 / DSM 44775 / JCM 13855 / CB1190) TaxID=675635 RepID=F4CS51_PSEUX|nr:hypothetical protein Psed_0338 [Pseudonocardia dioxanivorans CB1190]